MLDEATKLSRLLPKKEADYFAKDRRIETVADLLAFGRAATRPTRATWGVSGSGSTSPWSRP